MEVGTEKTRDRRGTRDKYMANEHTTKAKKDVKLRTKI